MVKLFVSFLITADSFDTVHFVNQHVKQRDSQEKSSVPSNNGEESEDLDDGSENMLREIATVDTDPSLEKFDPLAVPPANGRHDPAPVPNGPHKGLIAAKNCFSKCKIPGDCGYCGEGFQCCRWRDFDHQEVGCELARNVPNSSSVCGAFKYKGPPKLKNNGKSCNNRCGFPAGNCSYCGTGQCCNGFNAQRGIKGCERYDKSNSEYTCGRWEKAHPEPKDFRNLDSKGISRRPRGTIPTPPPATMPKKKNRREEKEWKLTQTPGWISALKATSADHVLPSYNGDGGQPWSPWEMVLVRDMIVQQIKGATAGRRDVSAAKLVRLTFHDCVKHKNGGGGCDGCLNWHKMKTDVWGDNTRAEDRYFEDHEREPTNIGLHHVVEFLEHVYTFNFGQVEADCWMKPGLVNGGTPVFPKNLGAKHKRAGSEDIWVDRPEECQKLCRSMKENRDGQEESCDYFSVPDTEWVGGQGPCRLLKKTANSRIRKQDGDGRLIAGTKLCPKSAEWSLKSRGKSRADLWAFAGIVALEESIDRQNEACDGNRKGRHDNGQVMCVQKELEYGCKVIPSRPFVFTTGRKDCVTSKSKPYMAMEEELHPDDHFNGTMTVKFMEEHFGFNARETVAIMGAHTLGKFTQKEFGHKYLWTIDFHAFNNQYYRNVAGREDWFFDDQPNCTKVGDAWGNPGKAVWIAKQNQVYRTGGPIQWIQKKVVCPNCADKSYERGGRNPIRLAYDEDCCTRDVPTGAQCRPDGPPNRPKGSKATAWDDDHSWGCEYSHFIFGRDETALSCDMGLMWSFDVDQKGFPSGCAGLETFKPSYHRFSDVECGIDGRGWFQQGVSRASNWLGARDFPNGFGLPGKGPNKWTESGCPADCLKQNYKYPGDQKTLSQHFEEFADDQAAWIEAFIPAFEKMTSNGATTLTESWPLVHAGEKLLKVSVHSNGGVNLMRGD